MVVALHVSPNDTVDFKATLDLVEFTADETGVGCLDDQILKVANLCVWDLESGEQGVIG